MLFFCYNRIQDDVSSVSYGVIRNIKLGAIPFDSNIIIIINVKKKEAFKHV